MPPPCPAVAGCSYLATFSCPVEMSAISQFDSHAPDSFRTSAELVTGFTTIKDPHLVSLEDAL
jgi:hypothetical protein